MLGANSYVNLNSCRKLGGGVGEGYGDLNCVAEGCRSEPAN